jgi:hypothetical protein
MANMAGNQEVLLSGSTVLVGDNTLTLNDDRFILRIVFEDVEGQAQNTSVRGDTTTVPPVVIITLTNWKNALGTAVQMQIGQLGDQPLNLNLFIHTLIGHAATDKPATKVRAINYTMTLAPAVAPS